MRTSAHLSATMTSDYVQGSTSPGGALAAETHLALCEQCRSDPRLAVRPGPLSTAVGHERLLDCLLAADEPVAGERPALSSLLTAGPWRRVARGVAILPLRGASGLGESVNLLVAEAGASLSLPTGLHLIVVLRGLMQIADEAYARGDIIETGGLQLAGAAAGAGSGSLCLLVGDADMYPHPLLGLARRARARVRAGG